MAAYCIAQIEVMNMEEYMKYASQTVASAEKHGGEFLVKGGKAEWIEGTGSDRNVIVKFESVAAAKPWYNSEDYQAILPIAPANSKRTVVPVEGV